MSRRGALWMVAVVGAACAVGAGLQPERPAPVTVAAADAGSPPPRALPSAPVVAAVSAGETVVAPLAAVPTSVPPPSTPPSSAAQSSARRASTTAPPVTIGPLPPVVGPAATKGGEDLSPGRYREAPDTANFLVRPAGTDGFGGSASSIGSGGERVRFDVSVREDGVAEEAGHGTFVARIVNVSGRTIRFAGGLRVVAEVTLDGRPWRTFELVDSATTELVPGQDASVTMSFPFDGPGQYSAWGSADVEIA